jgi:hypothetical protein
VRPREKLTDNQTNETEIKANKKTQIVVLLFFAAIWSVFLQGAFKFYNVAWFHYLLSVRIFLIILAITLSDLGPKNWSI